MQQAGGPAGAGPAVGHAHGIEAAAAAAGLLRCICGSMAGRGMMVQCEVQAALGSLLTLLACSMKAAGLLCCICGSMAGCGIPVRSEVQLQLQVQLQLRHNGALG